MAFRQPDMDVLGSFGYRTLPEARCIVGYKVSVHSLLQAVLARNLFEYGVVFKAA